MSLYSGVEEPKWHPICSIPISWYHSSSGCMSGFSTRGVANRDLGSSSSLKYYGAEAAKWPPCCCVRQEAVHCFLMRISSELESYIKEWQRIQTFPFFALQFGSIPGFECSVIHRQTLFLANIIPNWDGPESTTRVPSDVLEERPRTRVVLYLINIELYIAI